MARMHKVKYKGTRWVVCFGASEGIQGIALGELNAMIQDYLPYVVRVVPAAEYTAEKRQEHLILIGTAANNRLIAELAKKKLVSVPAQAEGYAVCCFNSPWRTGTRVLVIAGSDARGVLYGVMEFGAQVLGHLLFPNDPVKNPRTAFDEMRDFNISDYPKIQNRGIWTWGYVIYDYRRFIDNMARCKMNMLVTWNDCLPVNFKDMVAYAHEHGIRVIAGFHWGWGFKNIDISKSKDRMKIKEMVLETYRTCYEHQPIDGIYFQTLTEHANTMLAGRTIASLACEMVNDIARALFSIKPGLYIQFGLHATSILGKYIDLKTLDKRVTIMWEDAGVLPYDYVPYTRANENCRVDKSVATLQKTLHYSKKLATFRPNTEFALVPKGWICLRWKNDFEHHEEFILGERNREYISQRLQERQVTWDKVNAMWMSSFGHAAKFYREMVKCKPAKITVAGLIEDGMFEECIQPSVALFAETLWNPFRTDEEIMYCAMAPHYRKKA